MSLLHQEIDSGIAAHEDWALRRQRGLGPTRGLFVLSCMDERVPVEEALGIAPGEAHVFRNAGALATEDAIRSAMISTRLTGSREIIVLAHTECGMMLEGAEGLAERLIAEGLDLDAPPIDPDLPELKLAPGCFDRWLRGFDKVEESCLRQVEILRACPLLPRDVVVNGYVYEVESGRLRLPNRRLGERVNTTQEMKRARD